MELWRLLTAKEKTQNIAPMIAADPALVAEAKSISSALNARQAPCGRAAVATLLMPLVSIYGVPDRSEIEWTAFWLLYGDALSVLPREALAEAIVLHNREGKYFPKPSELFKLASPVAERLRVAAWRVKQALEHQPKFGRITEAERAEVRKMMIADGLIGADGHVRPARFFPTPDPPRALLSMPPIQRPERPETPRQAAARAQRMLETVSYKRKPVDVMDLLD
jgi:hypothetical protein